MRPLVERYAEQAFVALVTGAALIYPPAALLVAGAFWVVLAIVADRRTPAPETEAAA